MHTVPDQEKPTARKALGDLTEVNPTARSLTIMAAIERGEGAPDQVVRGWLTRALTASRGPQWCCDKCHNIHSEWVPICINCGAFDTLSWVEPPKSELAISTAMLPMIVGQLEDHSDAEAIDVAEVVDAPIMEGVDIIDVEPVVEAEVTEVEPAKDRASTA